MLNGKSYEVVIEVEMLCNRSCS